MVTRIFNFTCFREPLSSKYYSQQLRKMEVVFKKNLKIKKDSRGQVKRKCFNEIEEGLMIYLLDNTAIE